MPISLNAKERGTRNLLVKVAKGQLNDTRLSGLIGYQEFWQLYSNEPWGQGKRVEIIALITKVSAYELEQHRPPLNELVVRVTGDKKGEPGEEWKTYAITYTHNSGCP